MNEQVALLEIDIKQEKILDISYCSSVMITNLITNYIYKIMLQLITITTLLLLFSCLLLMALFQYITCLNCTPDSKLPSGSRYM